MKWQPGEASVSTHQAGPQASLTPLHGGRGETASPSGKTYARQRPTMTEPDSVPKENFMTLQANAKHTEHWPLDRLVPYERNPRTHSDPQFAQIAASIDQFGFTSPILVDTRRNSGRARPIPRLPQ